MEELNNSIPRRNENLIKAEGGARNTDFIGSMHTGMLLCLNVFKYAVFYWNVFNIHIKMLTDYNLI